MHKSILKFINFGGNNSLSYKTHKYEYYEINNDINSLLKLYQLLHINNSVVPNSKIQIPLTPNGISLGCTSDNVIKSIGKPKYSIKNGVGKNHSIIFYRNSINSINILSQFHFYNNVLVYVKIVFDYIESSKVANMDIYNSLETKYSVKIDTNIDNVFVDINKNYMRVFDNGQINAQYFYINDDIINDMRKELIIAPKDKDIDKDSLMALM